MTQILKRLEIIKSSIAIEDEEIIELQIIKLEKIDIDDEVRNILKYLENSDFSTAIKLIENYLTKYSGIVEYIDPQIQGLKLELKSLEEKLQNLVIEKTEYLNDIEEFNTQYNIHLGDIIKSILSLKKEILYKKTIKYQKIKDTYEEEIKTFDETTETISELKETISELEEALENIDKDDENYDEIYKAYQELQEELKNLEDELLSQKQKLDDTKEQLEDDELFNEYEDVKSAYDEFENEYEHIKDTQKDINKLNDDEKIEIKKLYKKAARLCHPDIVSDELKEKAHEIMQALNDAYSKKDIKKVKEILLNLETGKSFDLSSDKIEDKEILKAKIEEFKKTIQELKDEIEEIKSDDTFVTISNLDDWDEYFEDLKNELKAEKEKLEVESQEILEELKEKEEIDTFSQVIVIYKDIFIEEWIEKIWIWADYYNISKNIIPRNKKELLSIKELDLYNYYLNDVPEELRNLSNLTYISLRFEENLKLTKKLIFFIFFKVGIDWFDEDARCVLTLNKIPIWIIDFLEWIYDCCCIESLKCIREYDYIDDEETIPSKKNAIYLEELDFYNKGLEQIPEYIGKFHNLKVLKLGFNELIELPKSIIKLKNLKLLQLHGNPLRITEEQTIWMEELKKNGCKISCIDNLDHKNQLYIFKDISKDTLVKWIQNLWDWADENNISNGKLSRKKENLLATTTIDFTGLKLKNIPKEICNLENVNTFSIWDNDITYLPKEIVNFNQLKKLNLRGNPNLAISPSQKEWIENLREKCSVFVDPVRYIREETLEMFVDKYSSIDKKEETIKLNEINKEELIEFIQNWIISKISKQCDSDVTKDLVALQRISYVSNDVYNDLLKNNISSVNLPFITKDLNGSPVHFIKEDITFESLEFKKENKLKEENTPKDFVNKISGENSEYSKYIQSIENIKFEKIRKYCENLSKDNSADEMQKYLALNGKMHKALIYSSLEVFIEKLNTETITIIDWGCDQGIASILVLDYIKEKQLDIKVSDVILIDKDKKILSRAITQIEALAQDTIKFTAIKSSDNNISDKIKSEKNNIILNLFANDKMPVDFLDIDFNISDENYFLCVSNENKEFVDEVYVNIKDFLNVQNLSILDGKIGKFKKYERIFFEQNTNDDPWDIPF